MSIECELQTYNVMKCGLYDIGSDSKKPKCLPLNELILDLKKWAIDTGKPLIETSTTDEEMPSYCLGLAESKGEFLLALWNKIEHNKSGVGVVSGGGKPNETYISAKQLGAEEIPGFPSFYWIKPQSNVIHPLKIETVHPYIGKVKEYLQGYLTYFCSYRIRGDGSESILQYSEIKDAGSNEVREANQSLEPIFKTGIQKEPGKYDYILENHMNIAKVVKDVVVTDYLKEHNEGLLNGLVNMFNGIQPTQKKTLRFAVPTQIQQEKVESMINTYIDSDGSSENNYGFIFKGKAQHIEWLSGGVKKDTIDLDIKWLANQQPDIQKLLVDLQNQVMT